MLNHSEDKSLSNYSVALGKCPSPGSLREMYGLNYRGLGLSRFIEPKKLPEAEGPRESPPRCMARAQVPVHLPWESLSHL